MAKKMGRSSWALEHRPRLISWASVVGPKEGEGPLKPHFDRIYEDDTLGEESWEKSESKLQQEAVAIMLDKAGKTSEDVELLFAGDLLNQCMSTTYGLRGFGVPFYGVYGACSTMAESLSLAGLFVESGLVELAGAVTSSHFCSAERQFRLPIQYGGQRTPTSQWTVTGAGGVLLGRAEAEEECDGGVVRIHGISAGKIVDLGIQDPSNMGAAMAPAAAETIGTYLRDSGSSPRDYDAIITGDLGAVGSELLLDLLGKQQIDLRKNHRDGGMMIFDLEAQEVHAGGSGCGCSASVLCSLLLHQLERGVWKNVLFVATGALMSPTSVQQGESIPGIAHLVHLGP